MRQSPRLGHRIEIFRAYDDGKVMEVKTMTRSTTRNQARDIEAVLICAQILEKNPDAVSEAVEILHQVALEPEERRLSGGR